MPHTKKRRVAEDLAKGIFASSIEMHRLRIVGARRLLVRGMGIVSRQGTAGLWEVDDWQKDGFESHILGAWRADQAKQKEDLAEALYVNPTCLYNPDVRSTLRLANAANEALQTKRKCTRPCCLIKQLKELLSVGAARQEENKNAETKVEQSVLDAWTQAKALHTRELQEMNQLLDFVDKNDADFSYTESAIENQARLDEAERKSREQDKLREQIGPADLNYDGSLDGVLDGFYAPVGGEDDVLITHVTHVNDPVACIDLCK